MNELSQESELRIKSATYVVKDWTDFHRLLEERAESSWLFRGVRSPNFKLIPKIGRPDVLKSYNLQLEQRAFQTFKGRAAYVMPNRDFDDWQWLAYAQHIGVPTRLLDWSSSPMVAAFFALEHEKENGNSEIDRLIYCMKYSEFSNEIDTKTIDPFSVGQVWRYTPPLVFDRLRAQRAVFTIHPNPTEEYFPDNIKIIRIPGKQVKKFRNRIFKYGFDFWSIYPDGEGLGKQITWQLRNGVGLGTRKTTDPNDPLPD